MGICAKEKRGLPRRYAKGKRHNIRKMRTEHHIIRSENNSQKNFSTQKSPHITNIHIKKSSTYKKIFHTKNNLITKGKNRLDIQPSEERHTYRKEMTTRTRNI